MPSFQSQFFWKIRMELSSLTAISPIDGRYAHKVETLRPIFSESALMRFRVLIEISWLQMLSEVSEIKELPSFSEQTKTFLQDIFTSFSYQDAMRIKELERLSNHDVKAVEYFIKEKIAHHPELQKAKEFIHFACTSEDINNLAYGLMLETARRECLLPLMEDMIAKLTALAHEYAALAMLARTHGQPATPTTLGKELANFIARLRRQRQSFIEVKILGKFNGAVGNFNAHLTAYQEVDWCEVSKKFVERLGLNWNSYSTQIEPHDYIAEFCDALSRFNRVLIDLNQDLWGYIGLNYFRLKSVAEEVGSSTMPHKINPIDFENSEGNLNLANALFGHFATYLPVSRWQRDLRDSTLLRNLGVALGHSMIAYQALLTGLEKLSADQQIMLDELEQHWEVIAEAIQTILRRYHIAQPYEKLKALTRGKVVDKNNLHTFINSLEIPLAAKQKLLSLSPATYLGNAIEQARKI